MFKSDRLWLRIVTCCLLLAALFFFLIKFEADELIEEIPYNHEIKLFLRHRLLHSDETPQAESNEGGIVYILGGTQESLEYKFVTAARLYKHRVCRKIFLLSIPGITGYDVDLKRNLTKNEWALKRLASLQIQRSDIELISFRTGIFGTITEARGIADMVSQRGIRAVCIVTCGYHTKRAWLAFSAFLRGTGVLLHTYASGCEADLRSLLIEYFKLLVYRLVIIPAYTMLG